MASKQGSTLRYHHEDHLTGTSLMTDSNGGSLGTISFKPFGEARSGSVPTDKLFTGQRLDDSTEIYYYGARYYDSSIGRFISPDPTVPDAVNPQAFNRYSYVLNNPLKYIDPTGLDWLFVGGSNSSYEDVMEWVYEAFFAGLFSPGETIGVLYDWDPEVIPTVGCDTGPREIQIDGWLKEHQDATDLKIVGHSEGAAATAQYLANWAENKPGVSGVSQESRNLLDSQLTGVFLVEMPTPLGVWGFNAKAVNQLGKTLQGKGVTSADIYNSTSFVHQGNLSKWESKDLATTKDKIVGAIMPGGVLGAIVHTAQVHMRAKEDSLTVIKSMLQK